MNVFCLPEFGGMKLIPAADQHMHKFLWLFGPVLTLENQVWNKRICEKHY